MANCNCDRCGEEIIGLKNAKKLKKEKLCSICYSKNREERRRRMIEEDKDLKENLRILKNKQSREDRIRRLGVTNPVGRPRKNKSYEPKIKGSKHRKAKTKSNSYITFEEQKLLLSGLVNRGLSFEEAKERINEVKEQLKQTREEQKSKKQKTKEEMLEELFRI